MSPLETILKAHLRQRIEFTKVLKYRNLDILRNFILLSKK